MSQKLEAIQKIMLATGTINYLASAIEGVQSDMVHLPDPNNYHEAGIKERYALLDETVNSLYDVMEKLADYMNDADCISPIDVRATKQAFAIVSGDKDKVEK